MQGVPTGILADIPMSGVWRPVEPDERPNLELLLHAEPWGSALDDADCLLELVEADVQAGFAEWILEACQRQKSVMETFARLAG